MSVKDMTELEDLYLPYRPKKKTRASTAKEKGLQPLAKELLAQDNRYIDLKKYINKAMEIYNGDEALAGARDIIAEIISEDSRVRQGLRTQFIEHATIHSKVIKTKKDDAEKVSSNHLANDALEDQYFHFQLANSQ